MILKVNYKFKYFSMPSEMLGAMFNTAESVLDSLSVFTLGGGLTPFQESLNKTRSCR